MTLRNKLFIIDLVIGMALALSLSTILVPKEAGKLSTGIMMFIAIVMGPALAKRVPQ